MDDRKNRRTLNPAFAAAHGLSTGNRDDEAAAAATTRSQARISNSASPASTGRTSTGKRRLEYVIKQAIDTGKLLAANVGLRHPLPDECFHFPWHQSDGGFTEELMQVVDFSDNNLDSAAMDEGVLRFLSAASLRFRHCGL
jgi:hypothetical protein